MIFVNYTLISNELDKSQVYLFLIYSFSCLVFAISLKRNFSYAQNKLIILCKCSLARVQEKDRLTDLVLGPLTG